MDRCCRRGPLAAAILLCAGIAAADEPPGVTLGATVIFNTKCANCHEGECSGRLSFYDLPKESADNHIRRYAGKVKGPVVRQLQYLLEQMKTTCRFYPMPVATPPGQRWEAMALDQLALPDGLWHFVPLGPLGCGSWRVEVTVATNAIMRAEIIAADFDFIDDEYLYLRAGTTGVLAFDVERPQAHYLRIEARVPVELSSVAVIPAE